MNQLTAEQFYDLEEDKRKQYVRNLPEDERKPFMERMKTARDGKGIKADRTLDPTVQDRWNRQQRDELGATYGTISDNMNGVGMRT